MYASCISVLTWKKKKRKNTEFPNLVIKSLFLDICFSLLMGPSHELYPLR